MSRRESGPRQYGHDDDGPQDMGGGGWQGYLADADVLERLGVKEWKTQGDEHGAAVEHALKAIDPNDDDGNILALPIYCHDDIGVNGASFLCPQQMKAQFEKHGIQPIPDEWKDGKCPACERREQVLKLTNKLRDDGVGRDDPPMRKAWDEEYALRSFAGKAYGTDKNPHPKKYLIWMSPAPMGFEKDAPDLHFYHMPYTVWLGFSSRMSASGRRGGGQIDPAHTDPKWGRVFIFDRTGKGKETKYLNADMVEHEELCDEWLDMEMPPRFTEILKVASYDEIAEAMGEKAAEPESTPDDEPRGRQTREDLEQQIGNVYADGTDDSSPPRQRRRSREEGQAAANQAEPEPQAGRTRRRPPADEPAKEEAPAAAVQERVDRIRRRRQAQGGE